MLNFYRTAYSTKRYNVGLNNCFIGCKEKRCFFIDASLIFEYNKIRYVCINFKTLGARESEGAHGQDGS